jgi:4-hydroxybutyryl-CoA dehydratase / vinylacetyl-CoA-Delta-isomerase
VVALPGPDEDHNPETRASLEAVLAGRADIPAAQRLQVGRLMEDLTASYSGGWYSLISLHGGGSPEAMKREIFRQYPLEEKAALVERLLDRGAMNTGRPVRERQPGRCCVVGCATDSGTTPGPTQTAPPAHTRFPLATGTRLG